MADRQERQAAQKAKIAAMPLSKRIAIVVVGGLVAAAAVALVGLLLSGEPNLGFAISMGIAVMAVAGYQYLRAPAQQSGEDGSR